MVRIAGSCDPKIVEQDYFSRRGEYTMGADGSPTSACRARACVCVWRRR